MIKTNKFKYFVDIKIDDTIIECNGDYWHCNPEKYGPNYFHSQIKKTAKDIWNHDKQRIKNIKKIGYNVIVVWELDYKKNRDILFQELINEICKNKKNK